jgi:GT2 family glycosyltransferase
MMPTVSVVIVNYNAGDHLRVCLASLADTLQGVPWDAVVVDNSSTDGSSRVAEQFRHCVEVVRSETNVGFGSGVNRGVAATRGDLVLIINPDCRAVAGLVQALAGQMAQNPGCAVAGPRVLDPDGSVQGSARGDPTLLTGLFGRTSVLSRLFPGAAPVRANVKAAEALKSGRSCVAVDWVSGACMLVRRAPFEEVGGFDEGYFLYWEDADLCRRLRARGYKICYVPGASVVHLVGQSSRTVRALAVREFHRSAYRYYSTHVARSAPHRAFAKSILTLRCWRQLMVLKARTAFR